MTSNLHYKVPPHLPSEQLVIKEEVDDVQFLGSQPAMYPQLIPKEQIGNYHQMPYFNHQNMQQQSLMPQIYVQQYPPMYNHPNDVETVRYISNGSHQDLGQGKSKNKKVKTDKTKPKIDNNKNEQCEELSQQQIEEKSTQQNLVKDLEGEDSGKTEYVSQNGTKKGVSKKEQKKLKKEQQHFLQQQQQQQQQYLIQQQQYYNPNQLIYQNQFVNRQNVIPQFQEKFEEQSEENSGKKQKKAKKEQNVVNQQAFFQNLPAQPIINPHAPPSAQQQQQIQYVYPIGYQQPYGIPQYMPQKIEGQDHQQPIMIYQGQPSMIGMIPMPMGMIPQDYKKKNGKNLANLKNPEGKETKNIPKNYARGIYKFIVENIDKVVKITEMQKEQIMPLLDNLRDKIHSIKHLREYWINSTDNKQKQIINKAVRILSRRFLNDEAYPYFYHSSRMKNPVTALKFRRYLINILQDPENFYYLKPKDKDQDGLE